MILGQLSWNLKQSRTRWVTKGSRFVEESLVKCKQLPVDDATWENTQDLHDKFINMDLEDKVPVKERGIDNPRRSLRVQEKLLLPLCI
jgi:hypothetical protein